MEIRPPEAGTGGQTGRNYPTNYPTLSWAFAPRGARGAVAQLGVNVTAPEVVEDASEFGRLVGRAAIQEMREQAMAQTGNTLDFGRLF